MTPEERAKEYCEAAFAPFGVKSLEPYIENIRNLIEGAIEDERERCARLADIEEAFPGDPPAHVLQAMIAVGPVGNARASARATQKSIAKKIRDGVLP